MSISLSENNMSDFDIIEAFRIIEKWRNSGEFCCIHIKSDYNYCWRIELTRESSCKHEPSYVVDGEENLLEAVKEIDSLL